MGFHEVRVYFSELHQYLSDILGERYPINRVSWRDYDCQFFHCGLILEITKIETWEPKRIADIFKHMFLQDF